MPFFRPLFLLSATALLAAAADDNLVLQWNSTALQAVRNTRMGPPMVARALGILHASMYDAWAAYDPIAVATRSGGSLRRPPGERTEANKKIAISFAAYRALVDLFPTQRAPLFDSQMAALGQNPMDMSMDVTTPIGIGNTAARALLDYRNYDGANQLGNLNPGAYSDYTGYQPINTPDTVNDPNRWQPFPIYNGTAFVVPPFLAAHWSHVIPFALTDAAALRPPAPAAWPHDSYRQQARDVRRLNARLSDREKMISEYWSDGPSSETPPGHWNLFAQVVSRRDEHTLDQDVKLFFALNNALFDAGIAVWDCKRVFDYARPITAIRFLHKDRRILAWAGPNQGTRIIDGKDWLPYQPATFITPPFPEYVSGHSTFSAASAEILLSFTGSDRFRHSVVLAPGSSRIEPGSTPRRTVRLAWRTFTEAADEAGMSRRYGGIHFEDGDLAGREMGRKVGAIVWAKCKAYFDGGGSGF
ncbi:MAG: DUF6851 domain-containing protein [Bryobacteraceae bacterium]